MAKTKKPPEVDMLGLVAVVVGLLGETVLEVKHSLPSFQTNYLDMILSRIGDLQRELDDLMVKKKGAKRSPPKKITTRKGRAR